MPPEQLAVDSITGLERFVCENDDLVALESRIGRFNVFDALGIVRAEIRHSNFLAFVLDPSESHGQGPLFLRAVLMDLLKDAPREGRPLSPVEIHCTDLRGVDVRREWKHIDVLITCKEPRFVVAIENKVDAGEHSNQLARYRETIAAEFPGWPVLHVFLTVDGEEPSDGAWMPYSFGDVKRVLSRVRERHGRAIGDDVRVFLDHYLHLIETRLMNDPQIDELCQRIYKTHRQALDLIFERTVIPSGAFGVVAAAVRDDARWHVFKCTNTTIAFAPRGWLEWLPPLGMDREDPRSWITLHLRVRNDQLTFYSQIGKMVDRDLRKRIVEHLLEHGSRMGFLRKTTGEISDGSTRLSSRATLLGWREDDDEPTEQAIRAALAKELDALYPSLSELRGLVAPMLNLS